MLVLHCSPTFRWAASSAQPPHQIGQNNPRRLSAAQYAQSQYSCNHNSGIVLPEGFMQIKCAVASTTSTCSMSAVDGARKRFFEDLHMERDPGIRLDQKGGASPRGLAASIMSPVRSIPSSQWNQSTFQKQTSEHIRTKWACPEIQKAWLDLGCLFEVCFQTNLVTKLTANLLRSLQLTTKAATCAAHIVTNMASKCTVAQSCKIMEGPRLQKTRGSSQWLKQTKIIYVWCFNIRLWLETLTKCIAYYSEIAGAALCQLPLKAIR